MRSEKERIIPLLPGSLAGWCLKLGLLLIAYAADAATDLQRASLAGLPGVMVAVEQLHADVERAGLTRTGLHTEVELRLRKAGIPVLPEAEWLKAPGAPYLYVNVSVLKLSYAPIYVFSIHLTLYQDAYLARNGALAIAGTWAERRGGALGEGYFRTIRDSVGDLVDEFTNDFLAANPHWAPAPVQRRERALPPREMLVRQVQERLALEGFNAGYADGVFGPQTKTALTQYQAIRGLPITGELDDATLQALGLR